jgi:uncharacterized RmlC-like cupin family protein
MNWGAQKIRENLQKHAHLPAGCKLYQMSITGRVFVAGNGEVKELSRKEAEYHDTIHTFINAGNTAHYLIGTPDTSQKNPANATVKVMMMEPHNHFIPHSHGTEHFIYCQGYAGCLLYFEETRRVFPVFLKPGMLIYLTPMVPHAFFNRVNAQFVALVSNTGLGINHEEYAITAEKAGAFAGQQTDPKQKEYYLNMQQELQKLEQFYPTFDIPGSLTFQEKVGRGLYRLAEYISG